MPTYTIEVADSAINDNVLDLLSVPHHAPNKVGGLMSKKLTH